MRIITEELLEEYKAYLYEDEKSRATIEKYLRDVRKLAVYADGREITKGLMIEFKEKLYHVDHYKISSINSFLETVNRFFEYAGWYEARVKTYRVQKEGFCPEKKYLNREEYMRLLKEARRQKKKRLFLMLEVMASTGMRVSELRCVNVEGVLAGVVEIQNKGKIRKVLLTEKMKKQLLRYIREEKIEAGPVFLTKKGKPVDRSNIWKEMKQLCDGAGVEKSKVFPHNLRKLFAICLYKVEKNLAKVADILGHNSMETTRRYLRESSEEYVKALEMVHLVGDFW
jgi:site-specific recombinase XerD